MNPLSKSVPITKESIIEQIHCSENLPQPLFAKEGKFLPFVKGGKEGFSLQGLHYFGLTDNSTRTRSPASRPSIPRISFPSTAGWEKRIRFPFSEAPVAIASNCRPRGHQGDPGISDGKCLSYRYAQLFEQGVHPLVSVSLNTFLFLRVLYLLKVCN